MILEKIHKKLIYKKSNWLQPYIEFNIEQRAIVKKNKDAFGTEFFKLMNNAFYGKTLENVRNRQDIEIINNEKRFKWVMVNPLIKSVSHFDKELVAVNKIRNKIKFDKFNYIGFTILE